MVEENETTPDGDTDVVAKLQATVKVLNRDLDRCRQRLDRLEKQPAAEAADTDLRDIVEGFDGRLNLAEETLDTIQRTVEKLAAPSGSSAPSVVSWHDIVDERTAVIILTDLSTWVDDVAKTYMVDVYESLTECWPKHPASIQTLLNLQAAWYAAYQTENARIMDAMDLPRWRRTAVEDLKADMGNCTVEHKERDTKLDWEPPDEDTVAERARSWVNRPRPAARETADDDTSE